MGILNTKNQASKPRQFSVRLVSSDETIVGPLAKFVKYLCNGQLSQIVSSISERIPRWLYYSGRAYIFELAQSDKLLDVRTLSLPEDYLCRMVQREGMFACSRLTGLDERECYRRLDAGDLCFGVFSPNGLANVTWVHTGSCFIRGMGYLFQGSVHDHYIYGIMTDYTERGKGLYTNCLRQVGIYLFNSNATRLVQMVEEGNKPVLKTLPQLGYRQTKCISHIVMLGVKRTVIRDVASGRVEKTWFFMTSKDFFII